MTLTLDSVARILSGRRGTLCLPALGCILRTQAAGHPLAATGGGECHLSDPDLMEAGTLHVQLANSK